MRLPAKLIDGQSTQEGRAVMRTRPKTDTEEPTHPLLRLQRTHGNRFVQRLIARAGKGEDVSSLPANAAATINEKRGGGRALDDKSKSEMEGSFSTDFSKVRVHDDSASHALNRTLNAKAFTTGQDIFFSEGQYRPGSQDGKHLLAHELTHTIQQQAGEKVQPGDAVSQPHELAEAEAESAAHHVAQHVASAH